MADTAVPPTPPTLLSLPIEIRRQILKYAFIASCSPNLRNEKYNSSDILLLVPPWYSRDYDYSNHLRPTYGNWGKAPMTQILRINHQLLSDAISVLYTSDFTFYSPTRFSEDNVNTWLRTIGDKKKLVKRIGVCIEASMYLLARRGHICDQQGRKLGCLLLKEELVNLTSVEISVMLFPSEVVRDQMSGHTLKGGENEKGIFVDMIMESMEIFPGLATLVVDKFDKEMKDVVEACSQRFGSPIPVRFSSSMGTERLLRLELLAQRIQLLRLAEQGELDIEENGQTNSTALRLWRKILTFVSW